LEWDERAEDTSDSRAIGADQEPGWGVVSRLARRECSWQRGCRRTGRYRPAGGRSVVAR
jgi:hypothetical protein